MSKTKIMTVAAAFAAGWLVACGAANAQGLTLSKTVVANGFTYYTDLAFDASGAAHVIYEETIVDKLYYVTNAGGTWASPAYLYPTSDSGPTAVSIDVDQSRKAHVAYDSPSGMAYATNKTGTWSSQVVIGAPLFSLALDGADNVQIAYAKSYGLNYTTNGSGAWVHTVVDPSGIAGLPTGWYPDLGVDSSGKSHIAYYDFQTNSFRYATNASGAWQYETLAAGPTGVPHLTIGPGDKVYAAYAKGGALWLAERVGAAWQTTQMATGVTYGQFDVAVGADGTGYVVFDDDGSGKERIAAKRGAAVTLYDLYGKNDGGYGPRIDTFGNQVGVLLWDRDASELVYLQGVVPEPATMSLLGIGGLALIRRRRKGKIKWLGKTT